MKHPKKLTTLVLTALFAAAALTGCSLPGGTSTPTPAPTEDIVNQLAGIPGSTALFTVDGENVTAEEYLFWLSQSISSADQSAQSQGGTGINWDEQVSGLSMADYCKNDAMQTAKLYAVVQFRAGEQGCTLTEEQQQGIQAEMEAMKEQLGGEEQYQLWLSRVGLTQQTVDRLNQVGYLYEALTDALYGEGKPDAPTDEKMDGYITETDLLSARHILLLTVDMNSYDSEKQAYASLSDEEVAKKKTQAEELLAQLRASSDPETLFDTLMNEYSEDAGLSSNPDGYTFTAGQMVSEFETATRALEIGQISDLVKSSYGYHIILRQDPDTEALRTQWISDQMNAKLEDWVSNAEVKTTEQYDALNPQDYYTKLLAHQEEIDAKMEALQSPAPSDSAAPTASSAG